MKPEQPPRLVPHPDRPDVWVRDGLPVFDDYKVDVTDEWAGFAQWYRAEFPVPAEGQPMFASPDTNRTEPQPGFWEHVLTWVGVALSGWLSFLVAHAVMELALATVGLQRSALTAASLGAIVGVVGWLVGRRR